MPIAIGLWLIFFEWPHPPGAGLDSSWQQVLDNAWNHRRAFGSDINFTYGPWGFLLSHDTLPATFWVHLAFQGAAKLLFAIALVEFSARLRPAARVMFLLAFAVLGWPYDDPTEMAFIGIVAFAWLLPETSTRARLALGGLVLGWLSLMKFSMFVLAGLSVATIAAMAALERRWTRAIGITVSYVGALTLLWLIAGQRLADSTAFLSLSGWLSVGYPSAMYLEEARRILYISVLLLAVQAAWLLWFVFTDRPRGIALLTTTYLALSLLFAWKQGITRAETNVLCLFVYSVLLATALPGLVPRAFRLQHAAVVIVLATIGIVSVSRAFHLASWNPWYRIAFAAKQLGSFDEARRRFEQAAAASKTEQQLPAVRAEVADGSIDFLGDRQALILFNDLNYRPRPVFQSYAVYTRVLLQKNFEFIQSDRRPEYLLAELQPIDDRFGGSYDSWLTAELPRRYEPVLSERGMLLLRQRRRQPPAHPLTLTPLYDRDVAFGERVDLPADRSHALWLEIDARPTIAGRLRSVLYKPAPLTITTSEDFADRTSRLVAPIAAAGFIVQPPLSTTTDLKAFVTGRISSWTHAFTVGAPPAAKRYWRMAHVKLSRLDAIGLTPVEARSVLEETGITDIRPEWLQSDVKWQVSEQPEARLLLHAPGEIRFRPPHGRRHFTGQFGILDQAYIDGRTDGVEFSISIVRNSPDAEQRVWSAILKPLTHPDDRGTHRFAIDLPDDVARVIVRTGPGPAGSNAWDWSYLSRLRFESREP